MPSHNARLLLVDDDPSAVQLLSKMLADYPDQRFATSGEVALRLAREATPDLILLDVGMPGMTGFDVCDALQLDPVLAKVPVIFVTGYEAKELLQGAHSQNRAAVFISKPLNAGRLTAAVRRQLRARFHSGESSFDSTAAFPAPLARSAGHQAVPTRAADELSRSATLLALTSIADRGRFDEALDREWDRAQRFGYPTAVLLVEVDQLKALDDEQRTVEGDGCLKYVAQALLAASLRPADLVVRQSDSQFMMLLPQTSMDAAEHVALRVLSHVAARPLAEEEFHDPVQVTVSIGVGAYDRDGACWLKPSNEGGAEGGRRMDCRSSDLVRAAGTALTAAIEAGRNQARVTDAAAHAEKPKAARRVEAVA